MHPSFLPSVEFWWYLGLERCIHHAPKPSQRQLSKSAFDFAGDCIKSFEKQEIDNIILNLKTRHSPTNVNRPKCSLGPRPLGDILKLPSSVPIADAKNTFWKVKFLEISILPQAESFAIIKVGDEYRARPTHCQPQSGPRCQRRRRFFSSSLYHGLGKVKWKRTRTSSATVSVSDHCASPMRNHNRLIAK